LKPGEAAIAWHFEFNDFFLTSDSKGGHLVGLAEDSPRLNFNGPSSKTAFIFHNRLRTPSPKLQFAVWPFRVNETKTESQSYFSQFDLLLNKHHTVALTLGIFSERNQFVGLDFFRPQPVTPNYKQRDFVWTVRR